METKFMHQQQREVVEAKFFPPLPESRNNQRVYIWFRVYRVDNQLKSEVYRRN